jgi:assimilatory nitrate reductase catalytic subunit
VNAHARDVPAAVRTTCPYCGVGCGVLARPDGQGGVAIEGDPDHPANKGRLCSKGSALGETVDLSGRLLHPIVHGRRATWDEALDAVADGFGRVAKEHGPDATAFYLSGQLLTEDYYVANKLMKGFVGTANVDTNSRLCMSSSVAGHRRAFGSDTVPGCYEDLDEADLLVLVGSNTAWCHPILYRRMLDNRTTRGARIVVIDPRRTTTGEEADLFLPIAPGSDTVLFSGLLCHLVDEGAVDAAFVSAHTAGFDDALAQARRIAPGLHAVCRQTGLTPADVTAFYDLFRRTERVVTCYSQGVNQSAQGTDKVGAIINCHLATGRIGRPGTGPFSLTGQPNAMGGREVGGLANMLAAHMGFSALEVDRVRRFWAAPRMAEREGLKAVALFEAIEAGQVKALWIMATNPAVSMPLAGRVRAALAKLDLLVVSDNVAGTDTVSQGAHILLPAAGWGEKDGTVTNSERRISRQRAFLPLPGEAKPDWWIVTEVAHRMGFADAFPYRGPADIFREHAALTAFENEGARDLDLGGLATLPDPAYGDLAPVQWPVATGAVGQDRFFGDGRFYGPDGKASFVAPAEPRLAGQVSDAFPLWLNTGRIRDQWHTMTRTGRSARLGSHRPVPFVEIHPIDAQRLGLAGGDLARISTASGEGTYEVDLSEGQQPGSVFVPIHWSDQNSSAGPVGCLIHEAVDPFSGQPEAKAVPASATLVPMPYRGFVLTRDEVSLPAGTWWARARVESGWGLLFATDEDPRAVSDWASGLFPGAELSEYADTAGSTYRCAAFRDGSFLGALFVGPAEARPQWEAAKAAFASETLPAGRRALAETAGGAAAGPLVCSCFGVGLETIRSAIASVGATTPEAIGAALRAGTNCGSCVPELRRILARELAPAG